MRGQSSLLRVGWIIGDQLSRSPVIRTTVLSGGGVGRARYLWVANEVKKQAAWQATYEVYRPWRRYDVVIFLKSMGAKASLVAERSKKKGVKVVFDANVNHYDVKGRSYYENMLPTDTQQQEARSMTAFADAVIADSPYLRDRVMPLNPRVAWIPDCVDMSAAPGFTAWRHEGGRLPLVWSGQSLKLFELLTIEDVLREYRDSVELVLVTNDMRSLSRWYPDVRRRFEKLLETVPHKIIEFETVEQLLSIYASGGIVISPRFLDNTYNLGHTEWKITLGMACGRFAVCSDLPSYRVVEERSEGSGIRVCRDKDDWLDIFKELLDGRIDLESEGLNARKVVQQYYSAEVVARQHIGYMREICAG